MKIVKNSQFNWSYSDKHDIHVGVHDDLPNNPYADIIFAKIASGHTLSPHYHNRPAADGYESFFFYEGGHIAIITEKDSIEIDEEQPFTVTCFSKEVHGIKNLGRENVIFQVLCAPCFDEKEKVFLDRS